MIRLTANGGLVIKFKYNEAGNVPVAAEALGGNGAIRGKKVEPRGGRKYECALCEFTTDKENGVRAHMARMHTTLEQLDGCTDDRTMGNSIWTG